MNTTTKTRARILDASVYGQVLILVQGELFWTAKHSEATVWSMLRADNSAATILDRLDDAGIGYCSADVD